MKYFKIFQKKVHFLSLFNLKFENLTKKLHFLVIKIFISVHFAKIATIFQNKKSLNLKTFQNLVQLSQKIGKIKIQKFQKFDYFSQNALTG